MEESRSKCQKRKDKLAVVAQAVKQVMKFRPIWADFFKDGS